VISRLPSQVAADLRALADEVAGLAPQAPPAAPPVVVPPPPTPAPTHRGLYVDGSKLRTRSGAELRLRGIELMVGTDAANAGFPALCATLKAFGANCVSPLFQGSFGSVPTVRAFCDAARAAGLVVGVNADHQPNGRAWLCAPELVALLNSYDHVFLECEVETDQTTSSATWATDAKALVAAVRAAGHVHPIKVGAPTGGRMVKHPLAKAAEVLASDPLHAVLFTFQCYWKSVTTGWQYSEDNGFVPGLAGAKQALAACATSGVCFVPGFDTRDDIGLTEVGQLMDEAHRLGLSYQYWVLFGDGMYPDNNLVDHWSLTAAHTTPTGAAVSAKLLAQRVLAVL
jgi:hypothetical protein